MSDNRLAELSSGTSKGTNIYEANHVQSRDTVITLLHIIGMLLILLCHFFQAEKVYYISEIVISGVPLFLFIAGFLSGKKEIKNVAKWYLVKAKRVLVPYYVFIFLIFAISLISDIIEVSLSQSLYCLFNVQGLHYTIIKFGTYHSIKGAGHLWYITTITICYLITPALQKLRRIKLNRYQMALLIVGLLLAQLGLVYIGVQVSYILTYCFGYFIAQSTIRTDSKWYSGLSILTMTVMFIRIICRFLLDATDFYDRYITLISSAILAVWIFYTMYFIKNKKPKYIAFFEKKTVNFIERISYYVYITHFMFFAPPFFMPQIVGNKWIGYLLSFVLSFVTAIMLWYFVEKIILKMIDAIVKQSHYSRQ